jgi:hypothetical protein
MKTLPLLMVLITSCASYAHLPDPVIPAQLDEPHAAELYEAYKLVCASDVCTQNHMERPIRSYERTSFREARAVLSHSRHAKNATKWTFFGLAIGGTVGAGYALLFGALGGEDDALLGGGIALGGAALSLALGLITNAAWSEPDEEFESAYNAGLSAELQRRVYGDPGIGALTVRRRAVTPEQQDCVRRYARSADAGERLKTYLCFD